VATTFQSRDDVALMGNVAMAALDAAFGIFEKLSQAGAVHPVA
jgi:hypothetical protein